MDLSGVAINLVETALGDTLLSYRELLVGDEEILSIWKEFISENYIEGVRRCSLIETNVNDYDMLSNYDKYRVTIALFLKGVMLKEMGESNRAAIYLKNIHPLDKAWRLLGDMFLFKDIKEFHFNPNIALKYYKLSLDINPTDLNTWRNIGLAHEALGQKEDARLAYKQIALGDLLLLNLLYPLIGFVGPCFLIVLLLNNFLGSNSDSWLVWIFSVLIIIIIGISFRILKTNVPIVLRIFFKRY